MTKTMARLVGLVVPGLVSLIGCGSAAAPSDGDGGDDARSSSDGGADTRAPSTYVGGVELSQNMLAPYGTPPAAGAHLGYAFFTSRSEAAKGTNVGPCVFYTTFAQPKYFPPSSVSVSGTTHPVTLEQWPDGDWGSVQGSSRFTELWKGGERLTASIGGGVGDKPPSIQVAADAVSQITLTEDFFGLTVPRSSDYGIQWTGGAQGSRVQMTFEESVLPPQTPKRLVCEFDAAVGKATVPGAALQQMPAGLALLTISSMRTAEAFSGEWQINFTTIWTGAMPCDACNNGANFRDASFAITLQ